MAARVMRCVPSFEIGLIPNPVVSGKRTLAEMLREVLFQLRTKFLRFCRPFLEFDSSVNVF